jgi:hypothetical protein
MKKKDSKMIRITATLLENDTVKILFGFPELPGIQMDITHEIPVEEIEDIKEHLTLEEPSVNASVIIEKDHAFKLYDEYLVNIGNYALSVENTLKAIKDSMISNPKVDEGDVKN